jgi:hypothetical protein
MTDVVTTGKVTAAAVAKEMSFPYAVPKEFVA